MAEREMIRNFWDLIAYQKVRDLAKEIFEISKSFPKEENYSLTDQIRRASRSVGAQIAEDCREINRLVNGMINKSSQFCGFAQPKMIKEETLEYFVNSVEA